MRSPHRVILFGIVLLTVVASGRFAQASEAEKPHAVIVVGTLHYSPELTMPLFAEELKRFGFRVTLVQGSGNPEKKTTDVLPGIESLDDADLAIFFMRFLKLPDSEWQPIEDYIRSGKPVIGLRTANHSFRYPKGHPRFSWNDDFGRRVLGTPYVVHQSGSTEINVIDEAKSHPILSNVTKSSWTSPGTLYLTQLQDSCVPLVRGSGKGRERLLKKAFGTIEVKKHETDIVAWAWENEWGGKAFYTSFGHPGDFAEESVVRMLLNACCWSTEQPLPAADAEITTWTVERVDK
ncbi:ThuA domain-containing protein [Rhodopirellula sallentina]|uniref:Putative secreted protein n=1 Tax=Rhodopirellula sallentina SM41 TaxID=1263870 RepID=M5TWB8_9BACT|nr:ThuA domain-containing protein [Rhodopirellula sallentina]EMI53507.1 putative secreted protein [Rhodopirellula sallentina SM41]